MTERTPADHRSRRSVLTAAVAAAAGVAAASLPAPTRAANGATITVGGSFSGTTKTQLTVTGDSALYVTSDTGVGLGATSTSGLTAVAGTNGSGIGVSGTSDSSVGVQGQSSTGPGVWGSSDTSAGVHASSNTGTGLIAESNYGTALQVNGKARFARSGRKGIAAGHSSLKVTMAGVTTSSYVVATLQTYRSGVYVAAAVPSSGAFTIYLNKAVTATTYVGYFVIN